MKQILIVFILLFTMGQISAQVVIADIKETADGDGIIDFDTPTVKGIALPKLVNAPLPQTAGTLYFDTADNKVKCVYNDASDVPYEFDLSVTNISAGSEFDLSEYGYNNLQEITGTTQGVIIGAEQSDAEGVLVLESTTKALILPKVNSYLDIPDPEPGMIIYDDTKNMFCTYNGEQWTFWGKP